MKLSLNLERILSKQRKFSDLLKNSLNKYQNRSIEAAQVIQELIEMAKEFKKDIEKSESLNLNDDEKAFYDALSDNESAREVMGDEILFKLQKKSQKIKKIFLLIGQLENQ